MALSREETDKINSHLRALNERVPFGKKFMIDHLLPLLDSVFSGKLSDRSDIESFIYTYMSRRPVPIKDSLLSSQVIKLTICLEYFLDYKEIKKHLSDQERQEKFDFLVSVLSRDDSRLIKEVLFKGVKGLVERGVCVSSKENLQKLEQITEKLDKESVSYVDKERKRISLSKEEANEIERALKLVSHIEDPIQKLQLVLLLGEFYISEKIDDDPALINEIKETIVDRLEHETDMYLREGLTQILTVFMVLENDLKKGEIFQEEQAIQALIEYSKISARPNIDLGPFILKAVIRMVECNEYCLDSEEQDYLEEIAIAFEDKKSLHFIERLKKDKNNGLRFVRTLDVSENKKCNEPISFKLKKDRSNDLMQTPQMQSILLNMESSDRGVRIDALGQCMYLLSVCYKNDRRKEGQEIFDQLQKHSQKENDQTVLHVLKGLVFAHDLLYPNKQYTPTEKSDRLDFIFSVFSLVPNHSFSQHIFLKGIKKGLNGLRYQLKNESDISVLKHAREYHENELLLSFSTELKYLESRLKGENLSDVPKNDKEAEEKRFWNLIKQVQSYKQNRHKRSEALRELHDFVVDLTWNEDGNEVLEKAAIGFVCNYASPLVEKEPFVRKQVLMDLADDFLRNFYTDKPHMQTFVIDVFLQRAKPSERFDRMRYIALDTLVKAHTKSPIQWTKEQKDVLKELLKDERAADFAKELLKQPKKKAAAPKNTFY